MQPESVDAPVLRPALFDRCEANRESTGKEDLVRQLADRLRARRAYAPQTSGGRGWVRPEGCPVLPRRGGRRGRRAGRCGGSSPWRARTGRSGWRSAPWPVRGPGEGERGNEEMLGHSLRREAR